MNGNDDRPTDLPRERWLSSADVAQYLLSVPAPDGLLIRVSLRGTLVPVGAVAFHRGLNTMIIELAECAERRIAFDGDDEDVSR
jgi:hypothetical protein